MATNVITLEYATVEKSLGDWGFDLNSPSLELRNLALDVFSAPMPGVDISADPVFAFEGVVILRSGRTGSGTTYSGGRIEFQGKRMMAVLDGRPEYRGVIYQFGGPWYDIDQTPFQQSVLTYTGPLVTDVVTTLNSDTVLFQKMTAPGVIAQRNNGQQITDILQHVLDMYTAQSLTAPFQIGTIGVSQPLNSYQVRDIKCSEAIQICLRCNPDAALWLDYSTNPPTVNVTKRSAATPVTLAYKDGTSNKAVQLTPRPDLQARAVCLYFKQTSEANGKTWITNTKQKYPGGGVEGGLRVIVQTIDLQGGSRTDLLGHLEASACNCNSGATTGSTRRNWWQKYFPTFQSGRIRNQTINDATIVADDGSGTVSLGTYPNVLDDGVIATWMKLNSGAALISKQVTIVATVAYDLYDADTLGNLIDKVVYRQLTARVTLTNAVAGDYTALASAVLAEAIPTGLAQTIYDALNTLQYEGTDIRVEPALSGLINMGNTLNLSGGRTEWATMKAQVQGIRVDYGKGLTSISVGPARHLGAGDLTALFLVNRLRKWYTNPAAQATAQPTGGDNSVKLGKNATKENTSGDLTNRSQFVVNSAGSAVTIKHDAVNALLEINQVVAGVTTKLTHDPTGQKFTMTESGGAGPYPSVTIDLPTLGTRAAGWVWLHFKRPSDCVARKMLVLGTADEAE